MVKYDINDLQNDPVYLALGTERVDIVNEETRSLMRTSMEGGSLPDKQYDAMADYLANTDEVKHQSSPIGSKPVAVARSSKLKSLDDYDE